MKDIGLMDFDLSQLRAALAEYTPNPGITPSDSEKRAELDRYWEQRSTILAAARLVERLLPGKCLACMGTGEHPNDAPWPCLVCDGSGQVWDEGIVEAVREAILNQPPSYFQDGTYNKWATEESIAVLSALVEPLTEKVQS